MTRATKSGLVALCAPAIALTLAMPLLSACGTDGQASGTDSEVPADVLVRGAEPGGMTAEWDAVSGTNHVTLDDDGKAFYKEDGEETSGMWLLSSPTEGEMMLSDGRAFQLQLDEDEDTLTVSEVSDEGDVTSAEYSRSESESA